jgi:hypothetical protein
MKYEIWLRAGIGVGVPGLAVMAMTFAANGTLYAVGDCNPAPTTFECTPDSDPTYNSLYTVNLTTGAFTRVGSTGAPQFFMDLAFDSKGNLFGVTTTINPTNTIPAVLYRIDPATGAATKVVNLVGSNLVMGLAGCGKTGVCSEIFFCIRIWFWTETVGSEVYLVDKGFLFGF